MSTAATVDRSATAEPEPPLAGVRVIDLGGGIASAYCSKVLADYGADVIKVETPGGDPVRRMGPFREGPADHANSSESRADAGGLFLHLNTNKLGAIIDTSRAAGADVIRDMVRHADIVVESGRPGALRAVGLDAASLLGVRPQLVYVSVTPFGQTGPYRDYEMSEIVAFAMGGPMSSSGNPDREPVKLVGNVVQMQSGATAATATLGALYHAERTGEGQHVDVATFETQNGSLDRRRYYLLSYQYSGYVMQRALKVGSGRIAAGGRFQGADGRWITTGNIWPAHVARMVRVLQDPGVSELYEQLGEAIIGERPHELNRALATWAGTRTARDAMREAQAAGWPVVVVNDPKTLLEDEQLLARGFWVTVGDAPDSLPMCGPPWRLHGGGWSIRRPAPRPGEHTEHVLTNFAGRSRADVAALRAGGVVQ